MASKVRVQISEELIKSAEEHLAKRPSNTSEQIEEWAYLGKLLSQQLTELEVAQIVLGNVEITIVPRQGN